MTEIIPYEPDPGNTGEGKPMVHTSHSLFIRLSWPLQTTNILWRNMKYLYLIILSAILFAENSSAQVVTGRVLDAQTREALIGATVQQSGTANGTITNANGRFYLELIEGEQILLVRYLGYISQDIQNLETEMIILLSPDFEQLGDVNVVSTRASDIDPVTQTTISRLDIEGKYLGQDPSVVLEKQTPSIVSFSDAGSDIGNYVQFRLRGMDQTRINTTLNGVPLNDMVDQGVFFSNFSDFSNSMESVQVQRGVGLSANGTASYAGSINFESISLDGDRPEFGIDLTTGSFSTIRSSAEVKTGRLENDLAFYSRFTRTVSDGFKNNSASDSYSFFFSGGYLGDKNIIKVNGFAGKTQNDQSYLPVLEADIDADPKTNYNSPNDTDDFEQELIQLQYISLINEEVILNSSLYYGGSRGVFPFGLSPTTQLMFALENDHYGFMSDVDFNKGDISVKGGIHAYSFQRKNINYTSPNVSNPDYEDETTKNEFSSFLRVGFNEGDLNIFADVQARFVDLEFDTEQIQSFGGAVPAGGLNTSRSWTFINPRIGARYSLGQSSVYASIGSTGREPTRTDILQGDGSSINEFNFTSAQDDNVVVAEHVIDYELGYAFNNAHFDLDVNLFYMDFKNEISLVGALASNSYVPLRQNILKSNRAGIEWVANYRLNNMISFSTNGAYMQTNVDQFINSSNDEFSNIEHIFAPDLNLNTSVIIKPFQDLSLTLSNRYISDSFMELSNDEAFRLPEVVVFDAQVSYSLNKTAELSLFINNIFDELYFTDGAPVDVDFDGTIDGPGFRIQPPRNAFVQLRLNL